MFSEDYLIRMITQALLALTRAFGLKKAGKYAEALQTIDQALEQLLGLKSDMVKQLEDKSLLQLLTKDGQMDVARLALVADLFKEEGDVLAAQQRPTESRVSYLRALLYKLEIYFDQASREPGEIAEKMPPAPAGDIEELVEKIGVQNITDGTFWTLFCYYEQTGAYLKAEQALITMAARPAIHADIQPELAAYYERLLQKSPVELASSGIDSAQLQSKLAQARSG